jgi:hypothetical protein
MKLFILGGIQIFIGGEEDISIVQERKNVRSNTNRIREDIKKDYWI